MSLRMRMKAAMLIVIMLCVLCVNSVLAKVDKEMEVRQQQVCHTMESDFHK